MYRAVSIALVAAWLAAAVHAAEPHVYCERHQAFEEPLVAPRHPAPWAVADAAAAGARHEACVLVGQVPGAEQAVALPVAEVAAARPEGARHAAPARPIQLLAVAPKTSPPRR
jgi:hypothetical protein